MDTQRHNHKSALDEPATPQNETLFVEGISGEGVCTYGICGSTGSPKADLYLCVSMIWIHRDTITKVTEHTTAPHEYSGFSLSRCNFVFRNMVDK